MINNLKPADSNFQAGLMKLLYFHLSSINLTIKSGVGHSVGTSSLSESKVINFNTLFKNEKSH